MSRTKPIPIGTQFGDLITIADGPRWENHRLTYICQCSCGNTKTVRASDLKCGKVHRCQDHNKQLRYGYSAMHRVFVSYGFHAKKRNIPFEIDEATFRSVTSQPCRYCGDAPSSISKDIHYFGEYVYNGIDRLDNKKGYTIDNVVPACKWCNIAKNDLTEQEFYNKIIKVCQRIKNGT